MSHIEKASEYIAKFYDQNIDPKYVYHDLEHTMSVLKAVNKISKLANLGKDELLIVQFAALFHDTGFIEGPENHEERGSQLAESYLRENGFDTDIISRVIKCILATKMNFESTDRLSLILQDADMSGLASSKFFEITEKLRVERNNTQAEHISKKKWDQINIDFLKQCSYKTLEAQQLYKFKKDKNLEDLIKRHNAKKKKAKDKVPEQTISTNKSAQTQFKTALRNHIDLSNIADNKANIMLSVNALILTLALPFLIDKSIDNPHFLLPTIIMSAVCLTSMIFATLSTRPIKMNGYTSQDQILSNNSNLFFFGNYHKMSYDEYKTGVQHVLSDTKALDDSITRDLYYLGRSLGKKFSFLRVCYNIFMYGITVTVISLLIVYLF